MSSVPGKPFEPRVLGRYAIYDAIASGGMATVHYGRLLGPVGFSRTVAIKRLHPQFAQDPEFVTMFLDEARLAGRIRHPNVVATLDVVASSNEIFLVMDYVHGESLARILREVAHKDPIPLPIVLRIATDALQGLHAAHEARDERGMPLNIVHRDISPQNILVGVDGTARLVDFGVAKATGQGQTTREGQIKGKLSYMAPEQLRGARVTRQTDVHAFAAVMWEMIAGRRLFAGETEADTIGRVVQHIVPSVSQIVPGIHPEVDVVLRKGLAESLDKRYASAREMCIALAACGPTATTMEVADWVQAQVHELIESRAQVVSAIERNQEHSHPTDTARPDSSEGSAKDWVARLSGADLTREAAQAALTVQVATPAQLSAPVPSAAEPPPAAETSISAVMDSVLPGRSPRRTQLLVGGLGALAVGVVGLLAWTHRPPEAPHAAASPPPSSQASAPVAPSAPVAAALPVPVAPSAAPVREPPPVPSASAPAVAAARPASAAPAVGARPKAPAAPGKRPAAPSNDVFDSRE